MSNPHWPQFPDVPNMTVDTKGRPNTRDLVPGQQEGTPINASLINPIIHNICDIRDELDTTFPTLLPVSGGNVTGSLSVQGKIVATINDIATETTRAQKAEASKLPLTGGDVTGIINAHYSINDKPGQTGNTVPNTSWVDQNYANKNSLAQEITRAQKAEAKLLQTVPATNNDDRLNNLVWNHTGKHLAAQLPDSSWKSFYSTENSVQALTYSNAEARPTTIRTLKNGWGGKPQLIVENDGFDAFNGASIEAVNNALSTETARAQAAENSKLPLTGGMLTGDLELKGNVNGENLFSKTIHLSADGVKAHSQIQLLGSKTNPSTAISTVKEDGSSASLFLNADNSVTTARGTSLPEISMGAGSSGRIVMQCFQVSGIPNGVTVPVKFPIPFASPPQGIFLTINNEFKGQGDPQFRARYASISNKENQSTEAEDIEKDGFSFTSVTSENDVTGYHYTLHVLAIGIIQ